MKELAYIYTVLRGVAEGVVTPEQALELIRRAVSL